MSNRRADRPCSVCGGARDGRSTSGMCRKCEAVYRMARRNGRPTAPALAALRRAAPPHPDIIEDEKPTMEADSRQPTADGFSLAARITVGYVPKIGTSTRRERHEEIDPRFRPFLTNWNVPFSELTPAEQRERRKGAR